MRVRFIRPELRFHESRNPFSGDQPRVLHSPIDSLLAPGDRPPAENLPPFSAGAWMLAWARAYALPLPLTIRTCLPHIMMSYARQGLRFDSHRQTRQALRSVNAITPSRHAPKLEACRLLVKASARTARLASSPTTRSSPVHY